MRNVVKIVLAFLFVAVCFAAGRLVALRPSLPDVRRWLGLAPPPHVCEPIVLVPPELLDDPGLLVELVDARLRALADEGERVSEDRRRLDQELAVLRRWNVEGSDPRARRLDGRRASLDERAERLQRELDALAPVRASLRAMSGASEDPPARPAWLERARTVARMGSEGM